MFRGDAMPLTAKGSEIKKAMAKEYGAKKGEQVFYASANAGKIKDVHEMCEKFAGRMKAKHGK
jgi:hypothetical protein